MVHTIFLAEGNSFKLDNFEKTFDSKCYDKDGEHLGKVRMREIRLYTCSVNEKAYPYFLQDLKETTFLNKIKSSTGGGSKLKNLVFKIFNLLRKLIPGLKDIHKDFENVKSSNFFTEECKKGNHIWVSTYPIGKVLDNRYPDGSEIV